jgi:hypothetical protein
MLTLLINYCSDMFQLQFPAIFKGGSKFIDIYGLYVDKR